MSRSGESARSGDYPDPGESPSDTRAAESSAASASSGSVLPKDDLHTLWLRHDWARPGLDGDENWHPNPQDVLESTTSHSEPLRELHLSRMRDITPEPARLLAEMSRQMAQAPDLPALLKIVVGVVKVTVELPEPPVARHGPFLPPYISGRIARSMPKRGGGAL